MKFTPDACITCGTTFRADYFKPCIEVVETNGQLLDGPFWFCSDECVQDALNPFIEKRFQFGRTYDDDPHIPHDHIEEWIDDWYESRDFAIKKATVKFLDRALAGQKDYHAKLLEQKRREDEKKKVVQQRELDQWGKVISAATTKEAKEKERLEKERRQKEEREEKEAEKREREYQNQKKHKEIIEQRDRQHRERMEQTDQYRREQQLRDQRREEQREIDRLQYLQDKENERQDRIRADAEGEHRAFLEQERRKTLQEAEQEALVAPRPVSFEAYLENTVIVAGAGWGKTQLLYSLFREFLHHEISPSIIVLDSTGAMVKSISRWRMFDTYLRDRIVVVDPEYAPSLNMLDFSAQRFESYTPDQRENMQTQVIDLFKYVFASQGYDLTGPMGTAFGYAIRLMMHRPNSTLTDLQHLLEERPKSYLD